MPGGVVGRRLWGEATARVLLLVRLQHAHTQGLQHNRALLLPLLLLRRLLLAAAIG
jgi:hypothetical protein